MNSDPRPRSISEDHPTASRGAHAPGAGRLLSVEQAAAYAGLSVWTIRDLASDGRLPSVRPPGLRRVFIDRKDLDRMLDAWKDGHR